VSFTSVHAGQYGTEDKLNDEKEDRKWYEQDEMNRENSEQDYGTV